MPAVGLTRLVHNHKIRHCNTLDHFGGSLLSLVRQHTRGLGPAHPQQLRRGCQCQSLRPWSESPGATREAWRAYLGDDCGSTAVLPHWVAQWLTSVTTSGLSGSRQPPRASVWTPCGQLAQASALASLRASQRAEALLQIGPPQH